jgi:hypothetical protein
MTHEVAGFVDDENVVVLEHNLKCRSIGHWAGDVSTGWL